MQTLSEQRSAALRPVGRRGRVVEMAGQAPGEWLAKLVVVCVRRAISDNCGSLERLRPVLTTSLHPMIVGNARMR